MKYKESGVAKEMKAEETLESLVFQLTPTRTRCDLVVTAIANGETEKICSGLLQPYLSHLKSAEEQAAKGGYSIILKPVHPHTLISWFTKATVQSFVRFVTTPDLLERVSSTEFQILQIHQAIAIQQTHNHNSLYHGLHPSETNEFSEREHNPKVELLRVLETRRTVLQKEQAMAIARAIAAGFEVEKVDHLISFAHCFKASRLMLAGMKFMELWRRKHKMGELNEVEVAKAVPVPHGLSSMNVSGVMFPSGASKQNGHMSSGSNGKIIDHAAAETGSQHWANGGPRTSGEVQVSFGLNGFVQGQTNKHPMLPELPIFSHAGGSGCQSYSMAGVNYYQNYLGGSLFYQPPCSQMEGPRFNSVDGNGSNKKFETCHSESSVGRSSKHKSGMVVIQNLTYIPSEKHDAPGSETDDANYLHSESPERGQKKSRFSKSIKQVRAAGASKSYYEDTTSGKDAASSANWQVFQSFLLRSKDDSSILEAKTVESDTAYGDMGNDLCCSNEGRVQRENKMNTRLEEIIDHSVIFDCGNQTSTTSPSSNCLVENAYEVGRSFDKKYQPNISDESFIVPLTSYPQGLAGVHYRAAIDIASEFHQALQTIGENPVSVKCRPDDLTLMPHRDTIREHVENFDPAIECEMGMHRDGAKNEPQKDLQRRMKEGQKNPAYKEKKSTMLHSNSERQNPDAVRRVKNLRVSPLAEAQVRAEKLRACKVDLQKVKKEKEEEERKRLEVLKRERQKRIAARARSFDVQSQATSLHNRSRMPTKLSPSSYTPSKFTDSDPGSSFPFGRLSIRPSIELVNSQKTKQNSRQDGTHSVVNGISKSAPSSLGRRKEDNGVMLEQKMVTRNRRLLDPKTTVAHRTSSKTSTTDQISKVGISESRGYKKFHSSAKSESGGSVTKDVKDEVRIKKKSTITKSDNSKPVLLPQHRTGSSMGASHTEKIRSKENQAVQKSNHLKSSLGAENFELKKKIESPPQHGDADDLVLEKNVLTHEQESSFIPGTCREVENGSTPFTSEEGESIALLPVDGAIRAPISTFVASEPGNYAIENSLDRQLTCEVAVDCANEEIQQLPSSMPYGAPTAQAYSMKDPSFISMSHTEAKSVNINETDYMVIPKQKSKFANPCSVDQLSAKHGNSRVRESSKGFRRLLRFGRKSHHSASTVCYTESGNSSLDDHVVHVFQPTEVPTLKSLLSEDNNPHTPKASRSFSIFSPFRSKCVDKKKVA